MLTAGKNLFSNVMLKMNAGEKGEDKEKTCGREMLTAGVVCPMRFERTTFRVGV